MKTDALVAVWLTLCTVVPAQAADVCEVQSGKHTAALVELYTSEGCSSCPPADRTLATLPSRVGGDTEVVPLALHVSYWDRLGWKDVFAQKVFDDRQTFLLAKGRNKLSYTPQFFVNGKEVRHWQDALGNAIHEVNTHDAVAQLAVRQRLAEKNTMFVEVNAATSKPAATTALFLAVTESHLVSRVLSGENNGATLMHANIARVLIGPITLLNGRTQVHQKVAIPDNWNREQLYTVAFVQDVENGTVLQAVSTAQCNERRQR